MNNKDHSWKKPVTILFDNGYIKCGLKLKYVKHV